MPYSVKGFFEIDEDMVQILLVLEVLFTQDSEVEDLFCGASSRSEPSLFVINDMTTPFLKYCFVTFEYKDQTCFFYALTFASSRWRC